MGRPLKYHYVVRATSGRTLTLDRLEDAKRIARSWGYVVSGEPHYVIGALGRSGGLDTWFGYDSHADMRARPRSPSLTISRVGRAS